MTRLFQCSPKSVSEIFCDVELDLKARRFLKLPYRSVFDILIHKGGV
jgi:hypothetical protein